MKRFFLPIFVCAVSTSGFAADIKIPKKIEDFAFIPSGTFEHGESIVSVMSFWMSETEITNARYREFLYDLKTQNRTEDFEKALPDTTAWSLSGSFMDPMVQYYFSHPSYNEYPVVNISLDGANLFCDWLCEKLKLKYGSDVIGSVRLPNSNEWTYAASGGLAYAVYSWGGTHLRDGEGKFMANFKSVGDENITTIDSTMQLISTVGANYSLDGAFMVAPAMSYSPNNFGLYNMCGNVSELVFHDIHLASQQIVAIGGNWNSTGYDIRNTSEISFEKANPYVGFRPVITIIQK